MPIFDTGEGRGASSCRGFHDERGAAAASSGAQKKPLLSQPESPTIIFLMLFNIY
jgi:hypothetical protein